MEDEPKVFNAHVRAAELHLALDVLWRVANTFIGNDVVKAMEKLDKLKAAISEIKAGTADDQAAFVGVLMGVAAATLDELHVHAPQTEDSEDYLNSILKGIEDATKKKELEGGETGTV